MTYRLSTKVGLDSVFGMAVCTAGVETLAEPSCFAKTLQKIMITAEFTPVVA